MVEYIAQKFSKKCCIIAIVVNKYRTQNAPTSGHGVSRMNLGMFVDWILNNRGHVKVGLIRCLMCEIHEPSMHPYCHPGKVLRQYMISGHKKLLATS